MKPGVRYRDINMARIRAIAVLAAAAVTLAGASSSSGVPSDTPPVVSAVDAVTVDLVVTDHQGRPVTGLSPSEFLLRDDGVQQTITSFQAVDLGEVSPAPATVAEPRGSPSRA